MSDRKTFKPPICPRCEKSLQDVEVTDYDLWSFDPEHGVYKMDPLQSDIEQRCRYCNCDLSELFPEGVASHKVEEAA